MAGEERGATEEEDSIPLWREKYRDFVENTLQPSMWSWSRHPSNRDSFRVSWFSYAEDAAEFPSVLAAERGRTFEKLNRKR